MDREKLHASQISGFNPVFRESISSSKNIVYTLTAGIEEAVVSEAVAPARFNQDNVKIYPLIDNRWLAVWSDERYGTSKIFMQQLDFSGNLIGVNQLLAGSETGADFVDARIKTDTLGRIYLFYRDRTNGFVYGSRYNSDLSVNLAPFLVNDTSLSSFAGPYAFDIYPNGRIVVVWENYSALGSAIYMRIYDNSGNTLKEPSQVNSGGGTAMKWVPSVAVQPGGGFLISWEDYRDDGADIYARLFTGNGDAIGADFTFIPPPASGSDQYLPQVIYSSLYGYIISWIDLRSTHEVYLQQYNPASGPVGENRLVSTTDSEVENWDLSLAVAPDGKLLVTWASFGMQSRIMGLRFDNNLNSIGRPHQINSTSLEQRWGPSAAFARNDRLGVAWTEFIDDDADIYFMLFDTSWTWLITEEQLLNDDSLGAPSLDPFVISLTNWYNLIVFTDRRNDIGDIYLQVVTNSGDKIGGNKKVNQDIGYNLQTEPAVAKTSDGALIVWIDGRTVGGLSGQRIYARYCSIYGNFISDEFMISETGQMAVKASPAAAVNTSGQALVAWVDKRTGEAQVFGRWLTSAGFLDGDEFIISDSVSDIENGKVHVAVDALNRFYVTWLDYGVNPPAMKVKWYDSNKSLGGSFSWVSSVMGVSIYDIAVEVNTTGDIYLIWNGIEDDFYGLYLTILSNTGVVIGEPQAVTDISETDALEPTIAVDENNYVATAWTDRREGKELVYYQLFDNNVIPINGNQPATMATPEFMQSPSIDAARGRAWLTWIDPRENGLTVYAATYLYQATDIEEEESLLPEVFTLEQNYPNPFNPSTVITFSLSKRMDITLTVYNLLGQTVKTLTSGYHSAGEHRVTWDGTDESAHHIATGVYLYRLSGENFSKERKMILLK